MVTTPARPRQEDAPAARPGFWKRLWAALEGHGRDKKSDYYLILGCTLALTGIGLMMVFSASSVSLTSSGDSNPFSLGIRETIFAILGLTAMFLLSRIPVRLLKAGAWPLLGLTLVTLVLVAAVGRNVGGNQNWISIGGFSFQPSELAKLALILWMATVLAAKEKLLNRWQHIFLPVVPVAALVIGFILLGHDLGTAVIVMLIAASGLFLAGAPRFLFVTAGLLGVVVALGLALTNANRTSRLGAWLGQCGPGEDPQGLCDQAQNGLYALASGGWFGVGLGQSRQKWTWIPEAHNDFIFAVIGEEFGLLGSLVVIGLYTLLAVAMFRVIIRHDDMFVRVLCGGITTWMIGQAFVNIAMVTGLLPVIGVPLPLISYGGTALAVGLAGMGMVLRFARDRSEATTSQNSKSPVGKASTAR
ncbi:putative lipid II flippase FtsW [Acaricomes phytoseiuli]|uniref:putative lipid II flippase FtsW n=1 Tax=Acaricomes phytoseiuli TaxID=291968 RepID=UPI0003765C51|nr:putative lipid II flippase FtsW [Acaricomes phytoseiuli]MCW1249550.1 putative lipid II flippase FtsW [Acaricomes phytoseiuli]